jgi:hypothetical protein
MDLAENAEAAFAIHFAYYLFLDSAGLLVWLGLLFLDGLALASTAKIEPSLSKLVCEISRRSRYRSASGQPSRR